MRNNDVGRWYVVSWELDAEQIDTVALSEPLHYSQQLENIKLHVQACYYDGTVVRRHCVA